MRLLRPLRDWPLHPSLIAAAFVLSPALASVVSVEGMLRALAIAVAAGPLLVASMWLATRHIGSASILATSLLLMLASVELLRGVADLVGAFAGSATGMLTIGITAFLIVGIGGVIVLTVTRGDRARIGAVHRGANQFALLLVGVILVTGMAGGIGSAVGGASPDAVHLTDCQDLTQLPVRSPLPDVYQILLDGYPRADVLAERFGFDNVEFVQALRDDGFAVDDRSHSNYTFTALTLSSMFNMAYVDELPGLAPLVGKPVRGRSESMDAITHGAIFSVMREAGYRILSTPSGWEHVTTRGAADEFLDHGQVTHFERSVIERTWIPELTSWFAGDWFAAQERSRITQAFSDIALAAGAPDDGPMLLFTHVPTPHLPILFGADGTPLRMETLRDWTRQVEVLVKPGREFGPAYVAQLESINRFVLDAIAAIDASPRERPAVVIVMSDHGYVHDQSRIDPRDRLSNLFAVRTPGEPNLFDGTTTPVNLYRKLLNAYLGTCEPLLADRYFVSEEQDRTMEFVQVIDPESHEEPIFPTR